MHWQQRQTDLTKPISLVIPIRDEEQSIENLIASIRRQTYQPDEILLVDGGSTDRTVEIVKALTAENPKIILIKTNGATPGKGRNTGIAAARHEWVALTDAGITLDPEWLRELIGVADGDADIDVVYGDYSPVINTFIEKCAAISYVAPQKAVGIRSRSIASALLKKQVWKAAGGFPDLRAAEDLIFMEEVERHGFKAADAPLARVFWKLRPDLSSTFKKFVLYSKHNVYAERQWDWHYGVAKQYVFILPFVLLGMVHSSWWFSMIPVWFALRAIKRIFENRVEFRTTALLNPVLLVGVMILILTIDLATFIGWAQAVFKKK